MPLLQHSVQCNVVCLSAVCLLSTTHQQISFSISPHRMPIIFGVSLSASPLYEHSAHAQRLHPEHSLAPPEPASQSSRGTHQACDQCLELYRSRAQLLHSTTGGSTTLLPDWLEQLRVSRSMMEAERLDQDQEADEQTKPSDSSVTGVDPTTTAPSQWIPPGLRQSVLDPLVAHLRELLADWPRSERPFAFGEAMMLLDSLSRQRRAVIVVQAHRKQQAIKNQIGPAAGGPQSPSTATGGNASRRQSLGLVSPSATTPLTRSLSHHQQHSQPQQHPQSQTQSQQHSSQIQLQQHQQFQSVQPWLHEPSRVPGLPAAAGALAESLPGVEEFWDALVSLQLLLVDRRMVQSAVRDCPRLVGSFSFATCE